MLYFLKLTHPCDINDIKINNSLIWFTFSLSPQNFKRKQNKEIDEIDKSLLTFPFAQIKI